MADSTAYNRDNTPNRRTDVADWFDAISRMVRHDVPFEQVEAYVDTALETAVAKYYQLRADEHDAAFRNLEADLSAHTCGESEWCYACTLEQGQAEGWRT